MYIKKLKNFILENKYLFSIFILSTLILLYQHAKILSWDFSAYVLNAKYLFQNGTYFETLRPPLAPFILGLFLFFGNIGEYLYIIFACTLFFIANVYLSDTCFKKIKHYKKFNLNINTVRLIFYFFSLNYFTLVYATSEGTELLSLAFFEIFLAMLLSGKISGAYLGLAFLARYSSLIFVPFMFINRKIKKIFWNFASFFLVILPWLAFNYFKFGNPFTSMVDSYANNVFLRDYLMQNFELSQILLVSNWFSIFFLGGLILGFFLIIKRKNEFVENKTLVVFLLVTLFIVWDYNNIPLKQIRYLFNLTLPIAFFSCLFLIFFISKFKRIPSEKHEKFLKALLVVLFLPSLLILSITIHNSSSFYDRFYEASQDMESLGLDNCEVLSPHWVLVSYYTQNVYPLGRNDIQESLDQNKTILIFKDQGTIDDLFTEEELTPFHKLYETNEYFFLGNLGLDPNNCAKKYIFDQTYVDNHCEILSDRFRKIRLGNFTYELCSMFDK